MNKLGDLSELKNLQRDNKENLFKELCDAWDAKHAVIKGKCFKDKESGKMYFVNLTNDKGDKLKYPNGKKIKLISVTNSIELTPSEYQFKFELANDNRRKIYELQATMGIGTQLLVHTHTQFRLVCLFLPSPR